MTAAGMQSRRPVVQGAGSKPLARGNLRENGGIKIVLGSHRLQGQLHETTLLNRMCVVAPPCLCAFVRRLRHETM